jgi:hypothetical protein
MSRLTVFIVLVALCMGIPVGAPLAADEATMKVAYLYNFAKFIQWPDEQRATLRLCVMGDDALGKALDSLIGKPVRTMQIGVRHSISLQDLPQCDLVFVSEGQVLMLGRVRQSVSGYPVLIVTESSDALPKGAVVALIQNDDRIVFEVDLTAARQLGFQVSAKLLQLARKVY